MTPDPSARPIANAPYPPTATQAMPEIAARQLSPVDLVSMCLARSDQVDSRVHSYIALDAEGAMAAARQAEAEIAAGRYRGPLHGIPFAVKDNYDALGFPTTGGSRLRAGHMAEQDAPLVACMKAAGAIFMGKLSTWEYGTGNGGEYFDLPIPTTRNPWDTERFAGGSSTGAGAAVAAGTTVLALGSDTTGSVRLPASACGVVGVKPTQGLLSKAGMISNCYSLDVPGPLTWTVNDAKLVLDTLTGEHPRGTQRGLAAGCGGIGAGVAGMRIGVIRDMGKGLGAPDSDMVAAFEDAVRVLEDLGARTEEAAFPVAVADCFAVASTIGPAESATIHEAELAQRSNEMGYALRDKLLAGSMVRAVDYITAQRQRALMATALGHMMQRFDAVVTFGAYHVAPRLGIEPEMTDFTRHSAMTPFSLSAQPTLVQCTGYTEQGLPLHWQIAGRHFDETSILRVAAAYEAATPWRTRRPKL